MERFCRIGVHTAESASYQRNTLLSTRLAGHTHLNTTCRVLEVACATLGAPTTCTHRHKKPLGHWDYSSGTNHTANIDQNTPNRFLGLHLQIMKIRLEIIFNLDSITGAFWSCQRRCYLWLEHTQYWLISHYSWPEVPEMVVSYHLESIGTKVNTSTGACVGLNDPNWDQVENWAATWMLLPVWIPIWPQTSPITA